MQRPKNETRRASRGAIPSTTGGRDGGRVYARTATPIPITGLETQVTQLQRQIADMESALADTELRLKKAHRDSASADEMVGKMLVRVAEVEGKLRAAQKQAADAEAELTAARTAQAELTERLRATEMLRSGNKQDNDRVRAELDAARTEATVSIAAAEEAQEALAAERKEAGALRAQLAREREERESLRARVAEFAAVCEERDQALRREEELEAALALARREIEEARGAPDTHPGAAEVQRLRGVIADAMKILSDAADLETAAEEPEGEITQPLTFRASSSAVPLAPTEPPPSSSDDSESGEQEDETQFFLKVLRSTRAKK